MAPDTLPAQVRLQRRRFTVEEYHAMGRAGILPESERVELLVGEVIVMSPVGIPHEGCVTYLNRFFTHHLYEQALTRCQQSVRLDDLSEPEPDIALLHLTADQYRRAKPRPKDVLLLIEVGATSAEADREEKAPIYAQAGIPELWLVDLTADEVQVCTEPAAEGYQSIITRKRGEEVAPAAFPDLRLRVDAILGA